MSCVVSRSCNREVNTNVQERRVQERVYDTIYNCTLSRPGPRLLSSSLVRQQIPLKKIPLKIRLADIAFDPRDAGLGSHITNGRPQPGVLEPPGAVWRGIRHRTRYWGARDVHEEERERHATENVGDDAPLMMGDEEPGRGRGARTRRTP